MLVVQSIKRSSHLEMKIIFGSDAHMFASVIDMQFQPGKMQEALALVERSDVEQIEGVQQFLVIDRGNDHALVIAIYENQAHQEAAGPQAQEIMGRLASFMAAPPNREGCEVHIHESF